MSIDPSTTPNMPLHTGHQRSVPFGKEATAALIPNAPLVAAAALSLSVLLHLGGGLRLATPAPSVDVAGGAPATISRLGNSFRDVTQGSAEAAPPVTLPPVHPDRMKPDRVKPDRATPQKTTAETPPPATEPLQPQATTATSVAAATLDNAPAAVTKTLREATPTQALKPLPAQAAQPGKTLAATPPTTTLTALPEATPKPAPKPKPQVQKAKPASPKPASVKGASKAERKGDATGQRQGQAQAASKNAAAKSSAAGNAAISNYQGKVWRKIQRARPNSALKGSALIVLTISERGRLTAASVARSSGSAQFDQLALRAARKAAPFPAPPDRKPIRLSFQLRGR